MRYRKKNDNAGETWLRAPQRMPAEMHQPLSHITREQIADVFASQQRGRKDLTVCFTGHRFLRNDEMQTLADRLDQALHALYSHGFRDFLCGGALGFDTLAAQHVLLLRNEHADVRLRMVIPCSSQSANWKESDCRIYEQLLYSADETLVLSPTYYEGCMLVRNRFMVDHSAFCVCFLRHHRGGTMYTALYAMNQEVPVLNLAIPDDVAKFTASSK